MMNPKVQSVLMACVEGISLGALASLLAQLEADDATVEEFEQFLRIRSYSMVSLHMSIAMTRLDHVPESVWNRRREILVRWLKEVEP